jgi:hypothetical protein
MPAEQPGNPSARFVELAKGAFAAAVAAAILCMLPWIGQSMWHYIQFDLAVFGLVLATGLISRYRRERSAAAGGHRPIILFIRIAFYYAWVVVLLVAATVCVIRAFSGRLPSRSDFAKDADNALVVCTAMSLGNYFRRREPHERR